MRITHKLGALATATASVALFAGTAGQASGEVIGLWDFEHFTSTTFAANNNPYPNAAAPSSIATVSDLTRVPAAGVLEAFRTRDTTDVELPSAMALLGFGSLTYGGADGAPPPSPLADDNGRFEFTVTASLNGVQLTEFSVDLATSMGADTNSGNFTSADLVAQLFYSIDGGTTYTAIGSEFRQTADNADNEGAWSGIDTYSVDLSSISLDSGDSALFRLAMRNNRGSGSTTGAHFVDNFSISAVPEPASLSLLGLAGLGLIRRRRQA